MQIHRSKLALASLVVIALLTVLLTFTVGVTLADDISETKGFRKHVTLDGVREHQAALQAAADENNGARASGTPGFDASAEYVYDTLVAAGYEVSVQEFTFNFNGDQSPPLLERITAPGAVFVDGVEYATMTGSGSGDTTTELWAVDLLVPSPAPPNLTASTSGCEAADFAGFPAGSIALMQRGVCSFRQKALNAQAAGASGMIIFNEGNGGRTGFFQGTVGDPPVLLPIVGTTFAVGDNLRNGVLNGPTGVTVRLRADRINEPRSTVNLIAETPGGDPSRVVVVGAHLDSVTRGPGINDNGSGTAGILEIAQVYAEQGYEPRNKLRFMWYGAEEFGLVGSTRYVASLTEAERDNILLMLNFDMIGSPNFVRFVYDGDNSAFPVGPGAALGPPGSDFVEEVFSEYFVSQDLASDPTPFSGRSDYGPFIAVGIPAGGLFTGAEGIKTAAQASVYGGTAGSPFDPCYHLACDTYSNVSTQVLHQMADAAAHAVMFFSKFKGDPGNPLEQSHEDRGNDNNNNPDGGGGSGSEGHDHEEEVSE